RAQVLRVATSGFGRLTAPATAPMKQWQIPEEQWMRYYKPDLDKAKKLMADAGVANGFTVKCSVIPTFPTMVSGAPVIAAQLKRMSLENVPHLWLFSADTIDFTQTAVKGFRQHPTTLLYGFEGVWIDKV